MLVTWQAGMLPGMYRVIVLATDEIHDLYQQLQARGVDFELAPTQTPRGTQAMFRDPFGNPLMLWEHEVAQVQDVPDEGPVFRLVKGSGGVGFS